MAASGMSPGLELLISAGRVSFTPSARLATFPVGAPEWPAIPRLAERHGMSAWVAAALRDREGVPAGVQEVLQLTARAQAARALRATSELATVVEHLDRAGIPSVTLKGPLLSLWLHGDLGQRRFADLDLLISRADLVPATNLLRALGYALPPGMTTAVAARIYRGVGAWPLSHAENVPLDLHWLSQATRFGMLLDVREVLRESITVAVGSVPIRIPSPTHASTLALGHAAKHLWISLELLLSIARLFARDDIDWMTVRALASRARAWNGAAAGLVLAAELFERELATELRGVPFPASVAVLQSAAHDFLALPDVGDTPRIAEWRVHRTALDTSASRLRYSLSRIFEPTTREWEWCALPDGLAPLYMGVRLVRLSAASLRLPHLHRKNALAPR